MDYELGGATALVTGAASGIGKAAAIALAGVGAQLAISDVAPMDGTLNEIKQKLANQGKSPVVIPCDVSDEGSVVAMVAEAVHQIGQIDILFNNAGVLVETPLCETSAECFDRLMSVNLRGTFLVGREVIRHMMERGGGRVINTASELAYLGRSKYSAYCASKAGIIALTRSWAREFAPHVLVNAIAPGPIDTPLLDFANLSREMQELETSMPLGRIGTPKEIAYAVLFLAGKPASYITGQTLGVNGGAVMT